MRGSCGHLVSYALATAGLLFSLSCNSGIDLLWGGGGRPKFTKKKQKLKLNCSAGEIQKRSRASKILLSSFGQCPFSANLYQSLQEIEHKFILSCFFLAIDKNGEH